jgi:hypothetical protein
MLPLSIWKSSGMQMQFACWAIAAEFSDNEIHQRSDKNDSDY